MRKLISYLLLFSLLGSSVVWANNGQVDEFIDHAVAAMDAAGTDHAIDHPPCDHHGHFSVHMLALGGGNLLAFATQRSQRYPLLDISLRSQQSAPPSKPPRA